MNAGRLKHRISIDKPVATQTSSGDEVITWTPFADVWAEIKPTRGRQLFANDQIQADVDTTISVRWSKKVEKVGAKWRIRFRTFIYDIQAAIPLDMAYEEIQFSCKSGRNEG